LCKSENVSGFQPQTIPNIGTKDSIGSNFHSLEKPIEGMWKNINNIRQGSFSSCRNALRYIERMWPIGFSEAFNVRWLLNINGIALRDVGSML